jgi:hypothetical protein
MRFHTPVTYPTGYAKAQHGLGVTHYDSGDLPAAIICWREAEKYYRLMEFIEDADKMLSWIADGEAQLGGGGDETT